MIFVCKNSLTKLSTNLAMKWMSNNMSRVPQFKSIWCRLAKFQEAQYLTMKNAFRNPSQHIARFKMLAWFLWKLILHDNVITWLKTKEAYDTKVKEYKGKVIFQFFNVKREIHIAVFNYTFFNVELSSQLIYIYILLFKFSPFEGLEVSLFAPTAKTFSHL